jgi:hypothetical protein
MDQNNEYTNEVEFNEEYKVQPSYYPEEPKIIQWVIEYSGGLVKDEKQASYVLFGLIALVVFISLFFFFSGGGPDLPSEREILHDTPNTPVRL